MHGRTGRHGNGAKGTDGPERFRTDELGTDPTWRTCKNGKYRERKQGLTNKTRGHERMMPVTQVVPQTIEPDVSLLLADDSKDTIDLLMFKAGTLGWTATPVSSASAILQ